MNRPWRNPEWQLQAAILTAVILAVFLILGPALCRGAEPSHSAHAQVCHAANCACAACRQLPLLVIDHHSRSPSCREFLAAYKGSPELRAWLHARYRIQWRQVIPTPDLPRFWRKTQLVGNGWEGEQRLREVLGGQTPGADGSQGSEGGDRLHTLQSSLASVESRFQQADQAFTAQLQALGVKLGTTFTGIDERLDETDRRITVITDSNLRLVRQQRSLDESQVGIKQKQETQTTRIGSLRKQIRERISEGAKRVAPKSLGGTGMSVVQLLTIAGIIGGEAWAEAWAAGYC